MPKSASKAKTKTRGGKRGRRPIAAQRRPVSRAATKPPACHGQIVRDGRVEYVLVPVDEYERLIKAEMANVAMAQLEDADTEWVDAADLAVELAGERIAKARKAAGMTQQQLGAKLNLPQSQISRIERRPDRTTVRTLKRIARALGVDVSALV